MSDGWDESAAAWIAAMGESGDYGRTHVLDPAMLDRVRRTSFENALDIGCGEGRFCRIMQTLGIATVGIDPTAALIERARELDPRGDYRVARAESIGVAEDSFDLIVCYLSLIDIPDLESAADEMVRALRLGGTLLVANLSSFNTAGMPDGWERDASGVRRFSIDRYLEDRAVWVSWDGITVQNWHRPLSTYLALFLERGLELQYFAEPTPIGGDPMRAAHYRRVPFFNVMEWRKKGS
jgi:SAM-dependent methyltransferase